MATVGTSDAAGMQSELRFPTGIGNLDGLLGGGLLSFGPFWPCAVIKGPPGCGKSILSATIAAAFFKHNHSVAYLSLDQTTAETAAMISSFEWAPFAGGLIAGEEDDFRQYDLEGNELFVDAETMDDDGAKILLSHFPVNRLKASDCADYPHDDNRLLDWDSRLNKYIRCRASQLARCRLVVVDALSDILQAGSSEEDRRLFHIRRGMFCRICELARVLKSIVMVVLEKRANQDWRDYVADIVIDMGWRENTSGHVERYLQVEKARHTASIPGRHEMRIVSGKGIVIFPSQRECLRAYKGANESKSHSRTKDDFCGNEGLQRMFGGEGILQGSAALIFGPDSTRKNVLAARFLQQGLREAEAQSEVPPRALFLAAGLTEDVARDMLRRYFDGDAQEIDKRLGQVDVICSDWSQSCDELFDRVRKAVSRQNTVRAIVHDVEAFATTSHDVLPIRELLVQRRISSLFVQTTNVHRESDIRECFDTVLRSTHLIPENGVRRIGYQVLKLNGTMRTVENSWELCFDEETRELTIEPSFREYDESEDGHLRPSKLRLTTHCEYETFEKEWDRLLRAAFSAESSSVTVETFRRGDAELLLQEILLRHASQPPVATHVFAFDEPWFDELVRRKRLEPLDRFFTEAELSQHNSLSLARCRGLTIEDESIPRGALYALPQYLNCGFYVIRRDLVDDDLLAKHGISLERHEPWSKWLGLARDALREYVPRKTKELIEVYGDDTHTIQEMSSRLPPPFSCSTTFDEDVVCSVLEVVWQSLFRDGEFLRFSDEEVVRAFVSWHSLLKDAGAVPLCGTDEEQHAVIQRHWVVSYWKTLSDIPELVEKLQIIPLPTLTVEGCDHEYQTTSIAGEWLVGILRGSPNLHRGASAIRALTNRSMNRAVLNRRIGLPSHSSVIVADETQQMEALYRDTVSRRQIPNYYDVRLILRRGFEKIFRSADWTPDEIRESLIEMDRRVQVVQEHRDLTALS